MKLREFAVPLKKYPVFNKQDLAIIFPKVNFKILNNQLSLWRKKEFIIKLKNGVYLLASEFLPDLIQPVFVSSKIYSPSYISLEYALSYYNIIPEATFEITSVSTKATRRFVTPLGVFSYRTLKKDCFFGFETRKTGNFVYYFAEKEKAILDFLYLNLFRFQKDFVSIFEEWRLDNLDTVNFSLLIKYAKKFNNKKLLEVVSNLKKYAKSN